MRLTSFLTKAGEVHIVLGLCVLSLGQLAPIFIKPGMLFFAGGVILVASGALLHLASK